MSATVAPAVLYPELSVSEIDEIIEPLDGVPLELPAPDLLDALPSLDVPVTAFGAGAEDYSFHRICAHVARHAWSAGWDDALSPSIADLDRFRAEVEVFLVRDVFGLLVRPLAAMVEPVPGRDSHDVYADFCQSLLASGLSDLAEQHPVTWRRTSTRLARRMAALREMLARLERDRTALGVLGVGQARVAGLSLAGDTHAEGRSVSIVTFDDGQRLVYKPRSVDAEAAYAALVADWNARVGSTLRAASVLARDDYGYVTFVEADPEALRDGGPDLTAVGELAAVLYALNARDMHFENILATADGPVPVDLETLMHPQRHKSRGLVETDRSGYRRMDTSVFAMGVLPMVMARPDRDGYVDVGFIGGGEARGSGPFKRFAVENPFSAEVRVRWDGSKAPEPARREELPQEAQLRTHAAIDAMVTGFSRQYALIVEHREEFLATATRFFAGAGLRYVHNATVQYEQCLRTLTGAAAGADRQLAESLLKRIAIASRGVDHTLVASECAQLWAVDVPYFQIRADSTELTDPSGTVVAELRSSPLEQMRAKLARFGDADLAEQVNLIRIALSAKLPDPHGMYDSAAVFGHERTPMSAHRDELEALARRLAHQIADEQVEDRYPHLPFTWIGPVASSDSERPWPPGVLGYDLYTGRTGPALALAAAGTVLGDDRLVQAARRVFDPIAGILAANSYEARSLAAAGVGAYNGFAGATWGLWQAGVLLQDDALRAAARTAHGLLVTGEIADGWFDTVGGGVGSALVLADPVDAPGLPLHEALAYVERTGLIGRLQSSGMAHGISGVLHFGARTGAGELVREAHAALLEGFGASGFPLRTNRVGIENHTDSWCNGTAGTLVALHEAVSRDLLPASVLDAPLQGLADGEVSTSLTLCHGALGLYDALGLAGAVVAGESADELRSALRGLLTPQLIEQRLADPMIRYNQSPALMTGRAGVLWHLLERLSPGLLPSPLALDRGISFGEQS